MTYGKWHKVLRVEKGPHTTCVQCGAPAREWALKEQYHVDGQRVFVEDLNAYEDMCVSCHRKRDFSDEHRFRISQALVGRKLSEQHKQNLRRTA